MTKPKTSPSATTSKRQQRLAIDSTAEKGVLGEIGQNRVRFDAGLVAPLQRNGKRGNHGKQGRRGQQRGFTAEYGKQAH